MDELDKEFQDFLTKLEDSNCPFIRDVDNNGIKEMFFKPGESRTEIFKWLVLSFNAKAFSKFKTLNETSISKYLIEVFCDLGYCEDDCMPVIQGTASVKLQLEFFHSILNALIYKRNSSRSIPFQLNETIDVNNFLQPDYTIAQSSFNISKDIERSSFQDPTFLDATLKNEILPSFSEKVPLGIQTNMEPKQNIEYINENKDIERFSFQYSTFIDTILENEILPNFVEEVPLDIRTLLRKLETTKKGSKTIARTSKEFDALTKSHKTEIEGLNTQIELMDVELKNTPVTKYPSEETNIKLRDTCNSLSQNSSLYSLIHTNEIQPSSKPEKVELSELGPACCSLNKAIQRLNNVKQAIEQCNALFDVIQKHRLFFEKLLEKRGACESPDGWIHDRQVFCTEFIRTLKSSVDTRLGQK